MSSPKEFPELLPGWEKAAASLPTRVYPSTAGPPEPEEPYGLRDNRWLQELGVLTRRRWVTPPVIDLPEKKK